MTFTVVCNVSKPVTIHYKDASLNQFCETLMGNNTFALPQPSTSGTIRVQNNQFGHNAVLESYNGSSNLRV